jgi:hypothetical protein
MAARIKISFFLFIFFNSIMNQLYLLFLIITIVLFMSFIFYAGKKIKRRLGLARTNFSMLRLSCSEKSQEEIKSVIDSIKFPVALDLVVEHIGRKADIFISSLNKDFPKLRKKVRENVSEHYEVREDDYLVFHHGGEYEVLACDMPREEAFDIDLVSVDMSKVNEIGEGAVVRMVFVLGCDVSVQMFFSAPSQFQLREIIKGVTNSFKGNNCKVPKNKDLVIKDFNSPDFLYRVGK